MAQSMWTRGFLVVALGIAVCSGAVRAQDAETLHPYAVDPAKPHPVLNLLHIPVPACWASHNGYSCSSFHSESVFIFGSCRAFFGEPCLNGPPPPPWAEGDGPPPPRPGCGCRQ